MEEEKKKKLIFSIVAGFGLYLLSAGISYGTFTYLGKSEAGGLISPLPVKEGRSRIDLSAPKTEVCPLNGEMFTKGEEDIWEKRRPLGIMIENHLDSRPQSGLSRADVIYEAVAEGGITRFLAVYLCGASREDVLVGPVRSTRIYYLDWISEYGDFPLYAHVGGANNFAGTGTTDVRARAMEKISDLGWSLYNDLDHMALGLPTYWRDTERLGRPVATEHTVYSRTDRLWEAAENRGLTQTDEEGNRWDENFVSWEFKDDEGEAGRGDITKIEFSFWESQSDYDVVWEYNRAANRYLRLNDSQAHKDLNYDQQLSAKILIVQFAKETGPIDANKHLLYQTKGEGEALIFQDGKVISGSWEKAGMTERTIFMDEKGKELILNRGQIWIEVLPAGNEVNY
jgi:hypothetical protein